MNLLELWEKIRNPNTDTVRDIGDILQYGLPFAALLFTALTLNLVLIKGWVISTFFIMIFTFIGKRIFNFTKYGTRPDGGNDSMPSGHTSAAFGGAAYLYFAVSHLFGWIGFALAALTGYSRIRAKRHWLRDVVAGAILAIVVAYVSTQPWVVDLVWFF